MATHALRLRTGLVFSEQRTAAGAFFVVKEPATGRFFRFREIEHFILRQIDRASEPEVIQKQVEQRFGTPVAPEAVERLVESARNIGLLVPPGTPEDSVLARPRRVRGSPLYLRVKVFDPDRLFSRPARLLGFLFTPAFWPAPQS